MVGNKKELLCKMGFFFFWPQVAECATIHYLTSHAVQRQELPGVVAGTLHRLLITPPYIVLVFPEVPVLMVSRWLFHASLEAIHHLAEDIGTRECLFPLTL